MAKIPRALMKIFGSSAGPTAIAKIGSLAAGSPAFSTDPVVIQSLANYLAGWFSIVEGQNSPAIEDMNAVCYLYAYQLAYLMQAGVPEWDATTTYYIGSLVNDGTGKLYKSLTDNNLNNLISDTTKWRLNSLAFANLGEMVYSSASGTPTILTGTNSTVKKFLSQTGTGSASAAPAWSAFKAPTRTIFNIGGTSGTYTPPADAVAIRVTMVGGGGGGDLCFATTSTQSGAASGGGGGAFLQVLIPSPAASYAYAVGSGGTGGRTLPGVIHAVAGTDSTFGAGPLYDAGGGGPGSSGAATTTSNVFTSNSSATGGVVSGSGTPDISINGAQGGIGVVGVAGTGATSILYAGLGGQSHLSNLPVSGLPAFTGAQNSAGLAGSGPGAGGGGAYLAGVAINGAGGTNGNDGVIIIEEFYS